MNQTFTLPIIFIMGPTASGKTNLSLYLARHLPCEIISVDSAMIYREMDIGTAKPEPEIFAEVPHHLINILDPTESYSTAEFREQALKLIGEIQGRGSIPLLVGGTMLYFHTLLHGLAVLPSADPTIRQQLTEELNTHGLSALYERLKQVDPVAANRINSNDPQRIQRALEIYLLTGQTMTSLWEANKQDLLFPYDPIQIALIPQDRLQLHDAIKYRFEEMLKQGLIDEVESLYRRGDLHLELPAIRTVGYRQIWQYLSGDMNKDEMQEKAIIATRQLAKRQLTWLRNWKMNLNSYDPADSTFNFKILELIKRNLST